MITKIISGGQTGAERAALDVTIKHKIPHDGWIPSGRTSEGGKLPDKYALKETTNKSHADCTNINILDADGTLIVSHGDLSGHALSSGQFAENTYKHWIHIDLNKTIGFPAALEVSTWILKNKIEVLHVTGPKAGTDPEIYKGVTDLLESTLQLLKVEEMALSIGPARTLPLLEKLMQSNRFPREVNEAVDELIYRLSLKDKVSIAGMTPNDIAVLNLTMGRYVKNKFGLRYGNKELMGSCRKASGKNRIEIDEASAVILGRLVSRLKGTHKLRIVK